MRDKIEGGDSQFLYLLCKRLSLFMRHQVGSVHYRVVHIEEGAKALAYPSTSLMQGISSCTPPAEKPSAATETRCHGATKNLLGSFPVLGKIFELVR